jgi:hypothetical protein
MRRFRTGLVLVGTALLLAAGIGPSAAGQAKVTICHKPGTADEHQLSVAQPAVQAHLAHGDTLGPCLVDQIIDADGIASAGSGVPGAVDVQKGDLLTSFPVFGNAGLDMFDRDHNNAWTQGVDDLHSEGTDTCPTAIRDGVHQLGLDCKVLDLNGDLANGDQVTCDIEVGAGFSQTPCPPPDVKFFDANNNGTWESGEDLVLDTNLDGVFD